MASKGRRQRRLMNWLLRSPFAGLVDGSVMLLTVTGRRTGMRYTLPVQYAKDGEAIWVLPGHHERKAWWRNLMLESPVTVRLLGRDVPAVGQSFSGLEAPAEVETGLTSYLRAFPALGRRWGIVGRNGATDEAVLRERAKRTVMVRIEPMEPRVLAVMPWPGSERPTGLAARIRRHPLGWFYGLTFLLSWGYWVPNALLGGHLSHTPGLLGPMLSALVVTGITRGRAGLRDLAGRMLRWRVPFRWYGWALAPVVVAVAVAAMASLGSGGFPGLSDWARMEGFPIAGVWGALALILLVNAYGEETGWRGFALPHFRRRHDELEASLLVFIPWALWHAPTFFLDTGYRGFNLLLLPGFLLGIYAGAVVLTWMYEGARSSILIAALWHVALNIGSATRASEGAVQLVVIMSVIVWSIVIARAWRRRDEPARVRLQDGGGRTNPDG